jgi:hypothetical protein
MFRFLQEEMRKVITFILRIVKMALENWESVRKVNDALLNAHLHQNLFCVCSEVIKDECIILF